MHNVLKGKNKKAFLVLSVLVLSNIMMFKWLRITSQEYGHSKPAQEILELDYMNEGLEFINWSYALLRYFRNNSPNT